MSLRRDLAALDRRLAFRRRQSAFLLRQLSTLAHLPMWKPLHRLDDRLMGCRFASATIPPWVGKAWLGCWLITGIVTRFYYDLVGSPAGTSGPTARNEAIIAIVLVVSGHLLLLGWRLWLHVDGRTHRRMHVQPPPSSR